MQKYRFNFEQMWKIKDTLNYKFPKNDRRLPNSSSATINVIETSRHNNVLRNLTLRSF